ncbi:MAG: M23 family metallopeptidase, partial [Thermoleophilia bacterium]|nr:M23 family metallopeptidase [Thermoleophilia bacterium]
MWKLAGISCGIPFLLILIMFAGSGAAMGACGIDPPPEPPGGFSWPATGELTRGWTLDCKSDRGHRGIDIAAPSGSPVRAAAAGTVSFAAYTPAEGGGMTISIDHPGGLRSTYLHVTAPAISRGDIVSAGQVIAITTETPLHFGIKIPGSRDTYYDPLGLLPPMSSRTGLAPPEADRWPAADYSSAVAGPAAAPATAPSAASVPEPSLLPEASLGLSIMPEPARPEKAAYPEPSTASKPAAAAKPSAAYKPAAAAKPSAVPGTLVAPQAADVDRIPAVLDEPIFIQKSH